MRLLPLFLALFMIVSGALAASAPLNKDVNTPIKTDTSSVNRLGWISIQTIPAAESSDDDQICAAFKNQFNATTKFVLTPASSKFLAQPDVPRNIIVTMNATATIAMKLTGTDIAGTAITENLTWAGESGIKASTKAFKTVTRIDATESATTVQGKIGTGDLLGLNTKLQNNTVLMDYVGATRDTNAPAVTISSTVLSLNTIDTSTAPGGYITKVWMVV